MPSYDFLKLYGTYQNLKIWYFGYHRGTSGFSGMDSRASIKTGTFGQPELFDPILTRHFLQYARRAHARISSSWHACMNEPASMTRHACCCCCCWLLCSSQEQLLAAAAASSSQQQPAASSAQHPAWLLRGHAVASKPGCMLHGMSCCFKTGMHAAWHELVQNRDACCMA